MRLARIIERVVSARRSRCVIEDLARTSNAVVLLSSDAVILDANDGLPRLLGRSDVSEFVGVPLGDALNMNDHAAARRFCDETLRRGRFGCDLEAGASELWMEASGVSSNVGGQACVAATLRDVSSRKAAEKELRRSCEALSAALVAAQDAKHASPVFLAKINHEIRTPLNGIMGLAEMLRHAASGRAVPGAEIRRFCDNIHRSGGHLLGLVDDLLDLSLLESGKWILDPTAGDLGPDIDTALGTLSAVAQRKRVLLENTCPPGTEWIVDRRALRQVVINLAGNAVKFSPPGSRVRVAVSASRSAIALQVVDQGPGIPEEERDRIMKPFGRGSFALTNRIDGVGLGLSIVSELMALHGGRLNVESDAGRGTTFSAIFPSPTLHRIAAE